MAIAGVHASPSRSDARPGMHDRRWVWPTIAPEWWFWVPLAVFLVCAGILFKATGFQSTDDLIACAVPLLVGAMAGQALMLRGRMPLLAGIIAYVSYLSLLGIAGMLATYAAATVDRPFVDASLLWSDRAIGYDWFTYASMFARHRWLAALILPGYSLAYFVPTFTIIALVMAGHGARVRHYLSAMLLCTIVTVLIFAVWPARTAWVALHVPMDILRALHYLPLGSESWQRDLVAIRDGGARVVTGASALIAFPSFHCITALLASWAILPLRRVRVAVIPINAASLLATPILGGHYLADMIAGAVLSAIALRCATWLELAMRRSGLRPDG